MKKKKEKRSKKKRETRNKTKAKTKIKMWGRKKLKKVTMIRRKISTKVVSLPKILLR